MPFTERHFLYLYFSELTTHEKNICFDPIVHFTIFMQ